MLTANAKSAEIVLRVLHDVTIDGQAVPAGAVVKVAASSALAALDELRAELVFASDLPAVQAARR